MGGKKPHFDDYRDQYSLAPAAYRTVVAGKRSDLPDWAKAWSEQRRYYAGLMTQVQKIAAVSGSHSLYAHQMSGFALHESRWLAAKRPYYNVWPRVVPLLTQLDLSKLPCDAAAKTFDPLVLRLSPRSSEFVFEHAGVPQRVYAILMVGYAVGHPPVVVDVPSPVGSSDPLRLVIDVAGSLHVAIDIRETGDGANAWTPIQTLRTVALYEGGTVHDSLTKHAGKYSSEQAKEGIQLSEEAMLRCLRLCLTVSLLGEDDQLLTPVMSGQQDLSAKQRKLLERDPNYAKKLNLVPDRSGYDLGRQLEVSPHWRNGTFAWYWVGKGRTRRELRWRRGTVVKRDLVEKVPTGRLDPPGGGPAT